MPLSPYGVSLRLLLILALIIPLVGQQKDFEAVGIRVITAADPGFFDAAKTLNTKDRSRVNELLSHSLVIENHSKRSVVMYSILVTSTDQEQRARRARRLWSALNSIALHNQVTPEVGPGGRRLVSPFFTLAADGIFSIGTPEETRSYLDSHAGHRVKVELDAVVFEDGEFLGPDRGNSFPEIEGRFRARWDMYGPVVEDARGGVPAEQILSRIEEAVEQAQSSSWYDKWIKVYGGELLRVANSRSMAEALNIAEEGVNYPLLHRGGDK